MNRETKVSWYRGVTVYLYLDGGEEVGAMLVTKHGEVRLYADPTQAKADYLALTGVLP